MVSNTRLIREKCSCGAEYEFRFETDNMSFNSELFERRDEWRAYHESRCPNNPKNVGVRADSMEVPS